MEHLTEDTIRTITELHSAWMDFEVAGNAPGLLTLCAENIELRPPGAPPVVGRTAVMTQLAQGRAQVHAVEISGLCLSGSNEKVSLTANYQTTYSSPEDPTSRQAVGTHLWQLEKRAGRWLVALVSWSPYEGDVA